jgi:cytochrome c oxidase cbb3-type subunit 2
LTVTSGLASAQSPDGALVTVDDQAEIEGESDAELGRRTFIMLCSECHGDSGDGFGSRQDIGYARPRSFLTGRFKIASTENGVPSDEDLMNTIRRGMFGSGMPSWSQLNDRTLRAVALHVRKLGVDGLRDTFATQVRAGELTEQQAAAMLEERTVPGPQVEIPPEPAVSEAGLASGRQIYQEACASCHGVRGIPDAFSVKSDFDGNFLVPTSLAAGIYKGGGEPDQLYLRVYKGLAGTAMPGYEGTYTEDELWHVVHYLKLLAQPDGDPLAPEGVAPTPEPSTASAAEPLAGSPNQAAGEYRPTATGLPLGRIGAAIVLLLVLISLLRLLLFKSD